ncbi:MAG: M48 family metalloprotease [Chloroflexota bacterium]|nr:M48 family metalloprotease [Chloroflexota bacterium]MDE2885449.1 M48 family metalloprotease [Chloroflexota bacterium]
MVGLARMMNSPIPREVQVSASNKLNAATDGFTLFITSGMERELLTSTGETTIAHELAHAQYHHSSKTSAVLAALVGVACLIGAPFSVLHILAAAVMGTLAFLTLTAFVLPLISRRMEYDADAKAAAVFGLGAMIATLQSLVPSEKWDLESDSHPSIRARVRRLGETSN